MRLVTEHREHDPEHRQWRQHPASWGPMTGAAAVIANTTPVATSIRAGISHLGGVPDEPDAPGVLRRISREAEATAATTRPKVASAGHRREDSASVLTANPSKPPAKAAIRPRRASPR
jgi:hypothetical protein